MSFATLALVIALGLCGPLLALRENLHIPVILGELLAGIVFGTSGFDILHSADPIFTFLADMGFAVVMFVAGTHVPVRDPAVRSAVSIMLAGFAAGLAVAGIGEPRRVARQLFAINDGFLGPLFFVWLGARLDLREFGDHPRLIGLGLALGIGAVLVHLSARVTGQPIAFGTLAAAQVGVPVAAVTVGAQLHVLVPGEASAMMLGALCTIAAAALAASRIATVSARTR
ncbi:cation:proton antiporter [Nocardia sp. CA-084685]|uniref:cation:proton antiporter domain-containing protein n=1 Tax=Nocardia sp. CA-084685 TaxID=3239970 RepID=UPI003D99A298